MGRINTGRVILGGLLAGLVLAIFDGVLNGAVLKTQWEAAMAALNLPAAGTGAITVFILADFACGLLMVWIYAAVRPRLGAGVKTAATVGIVVWFFAYLMSMLAPLLMGILPSTLVAAVVGVGFVQSILGTVIGASIYKEA